MGIRILLVDDSSTMRRIQKNTLAKIGYNEIDEAEDGEDVAQIILFISEVVRLYPKAPVAKNNNGQLPLQLLSNIIPYKTGGFEIKWKCSDQVIKVVQLLSTDYKTLDTETQFKLRTARSDLKRTLKLKFPELV